MVDNKFESNILGYENGRIDNGLHLILLTYMFNHFKMSQYMARRIYLPRSHTGEDIVITLGKSWNHDKLNAVNFHEREAQN